MRLPTVDNPCGLAAGERRTAEDLAWDVGQGDRLAIPSEQMQVNDVPLACAGEGLAGFPGPPRVP